MHGFITLPSKMTGEEKTIFDRIREAAPPLEDYIDTSGRDWDYVSATDLHGPHPVHGSTTGKNFRIRTDKQRWDCFREGHKVNGSIIDYVAMEEGIISCREVGSIPDDRWGDIIRACCQRFGVDYDHGDTDPETLERVRKANRERDRVFDILTEFAAMAHQCLDTVEWDGMTVRQHLAKDRAFSHRIIDELKLGFWDASVTSALVDRFDTADLVLAGLLVVPSKLRERMDDFSQLSHEAFSTPLSGRIIFPYWKRGKVVYLIGRKTPLTDWEDGPKYIKMRSGERYEEVSDAIKNDVFYGEDHSNSDLLLITEGVTDCISLLDAGYSAISPVTTRFRENDSPKLIELTKFSREVVVINDNERSGAGEEGALKTAKTLFHAGRNVKVAFPPRPPGVEKVDVDDYLTERGNSPEAVEELLERSMSYIDYRIARLREDDFDGVRDILQDLCGRDDMLIETTLNKLKRETGVPKTVLRRTFRELGGNDPVDRGDHDSRAPVDVKGHTGRGTVSKILSETQGVFEVPPTTRRDKHRFVILINGVEMEFSQRQMLSPSAFTEWYLAKFKELVYISKEEWFDIVMRWFEDIEVREEDTISDEQAAADEVLSYMSKGQPVGEWAMCLESRNNYIEERGVIYYASKHVQDICSQYPNVTLTRLSHVLEDYKASNTKLKRLSSDNVQRFWCFDRKKIDELGR